MSVPLRLAGPVVTGSARLDNYQSGGLFREEAGELFSCESVSIGDDTRTLRHGDFEHGLGKINGDDCIFHVWTPPPRGVSGAHRQRWHFDAEHAAGGVHPITSADTEGRSSIWVVSLLASSSGVQRFRRQPFGAAELRNR